ncbi:MAG: hypothetical protein Q8R39_04755 [bacterium]|nr:hypothetical protein [bacterium]MDZ4285043.1 hypothetical protein [Patescibacteria group bacterium]
MEEPSTIMISLVSNVALANLAQRGGVLEQLIADAPEHIRFVFLTAPAFRERLEPFLAHGTASLEYIEEMKLRRALEQAFRFFYSYLIFTGTTKILATFGARADRPPAGGNRHLAPIKWFVANTFGRMRVIKTRLVPWLYCLIFRSRPYRPLFERYHPELLFAPNIAAFPDIELVAEARRQGVRTIGMAQNWDHLNKYFIPQHADRLLVQNEPMHGEALSLHAYQPERVTVVGFPQFDVYAHRDAFLMSREEFCRRLGISVGNRIILHISGAAYALDEPDILSEIVRWITDGEFPTPTTLLVRPYVAGRDREGEEKKYATLNTNPHVVFNWERVSEAEEHLRIYMSMLHYADVVISVFSTTAIEAAIFDKPTLTIGFDGHAKRPRHESITRLERMSHFRHVLESGAVRVVRSFDDLREALVARLRNPSLGRVERLALVEKMCFRLDGRASERVAGAVLEQLEAGSGK